MAMHAFERQLLVAIEDIEFTLSQFEDIPWASFLLNPRRLRGSDFLMRWSQGVWAEHRLVDAVQKTGKFYAAPYGPSGVAPDHDVRAYELYFERLEKAGKSGEKKPDLLIFDVKDKAFVDDFIASIGGVEEIPFHSDKDLRPILERALTAIECENSLWVANKMPNYGEALRPMSRLGGKPGLPAGAKVPTVIIKDEDFGPLQKWQRSNGVPIHIWHVFFERAYGISLDHAAKLLKEGLIIGTAQTFQAPGGATTTKMIYKIYYQHAYELGLANTRPDLIAAHIEDKNGHILPYVRFEGGELVLSASALQVLRDQGHAKK